MIIVKGIFIQKDKIMGKTEQVNYSYG